MTKNIFQAIYRLKKTATEEQKDSVDFIINHLKLRKKGIFIAYFKLCGISATFLILFWFVLKGKWIAYPLFLINLFVIQFMAKSEDVLRKALLEDD